MKIPFPTNLSIRACGIGFVLATSVAQAVDRDWDNGGGTGDWNTATNWNADGVPGAADNVFVTVPGAATKSITLNSAPTNPTILQMVLGHSGNGVATLNHSAGTLNVTSWLNLGQGFGGAPNNGAGQINLSGTAVMNVPHNAAGNGGQTVIGAGFTAAPNFNTGTLNISGGTFNQTAAEIRVAGEDGTKRANGFINISGSGVLSHTGGGGFRLGIGTGTGAVSVSGNGVLTTTGINNLGDGANGTGILNISNNAIVTTGGDVRVGNAGTGVVNHTGGSWTANGSWMTLADAGASARGTYNLSGGNLTHNGATGMFLGVRGDSVFNVSGTGRVAGGNLAVGQGEGGTTPNAFWNQTGGTSAFNNLSVGVNGSVGTVNLDGGTFRINTINALTDGSSRINWGSATLAPKQFNSGTATGADLSTGTGFSQVRNSTTTFQTNETLTTGSGVGAASVLDLGGLYLSAGSTVFDHLVVANGKTLNLASASDVLEFNDSTAYLLRPFGFATEDYGSLPLVTTTGGGTIIGTFDTFIGLGNDSRPFTQYTGIFSSASALPSNSWYLEQTGSAITFHYKVQGTVPEPGTLGLGALGAYVLRLVKRRRA